MELTLILGICLGIFALIGAGAWIISMLDDGKISKTTAILIISLLGLIPFIVAAAVFGFSTEFLFIAGSFLLIIVVTVAIIGISSWLRNR